MGKDVAIFLGYTQPDKAITRHIDEDDHTKYTVTDKLGKLQETFIINESGLYSINRATEYGFCIRSMHSLAIQAPKHIAILIIKERYIHQSILTGHR